MKKATLMALCSIVVLASFAQVTQKEVKAAKMAYINDRKKGLIDTTGFWKVKTQMDSLYYEGLRAIRHDQLIPPFLRK